MNELTAIAPISLPAMVKTAAQRLASAQDSAEILEARDMAKVAYDAAKSAGRIARAKKAHDEIICVVYRAQADALEIESAAKRRLADEYDAAQERGEVASGRPKSIPGDNTFTPTVSQIGLTSKEIHEARQIRDAEQADPGIIRRTLDTLIERGEEPTKAAVRREIAAPKPQPTVRDDSLWVWGRLRDFDRNGTLKSKPTDILCGMTPAMRNDVAELAPLVREWLGELEIACEHV